jgi:hypothetical protein
VTAKFRKLELPRDMILGELPHLGDTSVGPIMFEKHMVGLGLSAGGSLGCTIEYSWWNFFFIVEILYVPYVFREHTARLIREESSGLTDTVFQKEHMV